jgi:hypothetical protein
MIEHITPFLDHVLADGGLPIGWVKPSDQLNRDESAEPDTGNRRAKHQHDPELGAKANMDWGFVA